MKGKLTPSKRNDEPRKWYEKGKKTVAEKENVPAKAPMKKNVSTPISAETTSMNHGESSAGFGFNGPRCRS